MCYIHIRMYVQPIHSIMNTFYMKWYTNIIGFIGIMYF
jgi:hypothetical protein